MKIDCSGCGSEIDFEHDGPECFARCPLEECCFACDRWFHPAGTTLRAIRDEDGGRRCPHCQHFFCRECGEGHERRHRESLRALELLSHDHWEEEKERRLRDHEVAWDDRDQT
jgi:hypothetical protein